MRNSREHTKNIYCIMVSGVDLSEAALDCLYYSARRLMKTKKDHVRVVHDDVTGEIETNGDIVILGSVAGIMFEASINTVKGSSKVKFLVNKKENKVPLKWLKLGTRFEEN